MTGDDIRADYVRLARWDRPSRSFPMGRAAAMNEPMGAGAPRVYRKGITVYSHEVIPGDLMRDQGQLRTVQHVEPAEADRRTWLVCFEPLPGYSSRLLVPSRIQVYVRRVCRDR